MNVLPQQEESQILGEDSPLKVCQQIKMPLMICAISQIGSYLTKGVSLFK